MLRKYCQPNNGELKNFFCSIFFSENVGSSNTENMIYNTGANHILSVKQTDSAHAAAFEIDAHGTVQCIHPCRTNRFKPDTAYLKSKHKI